MNRLKLLPGTLLIAAVSLSAPASAQIDQLDPQAIEAATVYALPIAFDGFRKTCADRLAPDGFVAINENRLEAKFSAGAADAWPEAKAVLIEMAAKEGDGADAFLRDLPDEALKPFVDGVFQSIIAGEIKPQQCGDIERGLELLDPMPVENIAGLLGFIIELDNRNKARKQAEEESRLRGAVTE